MQFASDGYVITGDPLTLMGAQATIRVGDGTAPGAAYTATIESQIIGTSELVKTDLGTLILAGNNSYSGGTAVNTGTLLVNGDQSAATGVTSVGAATLGRSEEHTSELPSLMRISYAVFCLNKNNNNQPS